MFLESVLLFIFLLIIIYIVNKRTKDEFKNIPNISKIPVIGGLFALLSLHPDDLHIKFQEYVLHFGKTFYANIFGIRVVVTADVRYIDDVLSSQKQIRKHVVYYLLRGWLGNGLLLSHGEKWRKMRKIITPTFHFKILEQFVEVFDQQSNILVQRLQQFADGKTIVDIYPYMGLATLDIIAETAMGVSINAQLNVKSDFVQAVTDVTNIVATRFVRPYLSYFAFILRYLTPNHYKKHDRGIIVMHRFTANIIEARRQALQSNGVHNPKTNLEQDVGIKKRMALLVVLLHSTIDGVPLSDEQIRDEVNTFMFEGHDTTTSATSFCLYLLSRNATSQQKLFDEIHLHFGDNLETPITYNDLVNLNYLNCVIKETLRLYPPIPAIGRWLSEDFKLADVTLPAGTNVIILLWQLLRDPEVFPEPERFCPERHMENNPRLHSFNNIPFSAGPRNCIGQRFALFEMKTIVVKILRAYELTKLGEPIKPSIKIVLRSKTGVNFGIKQRAY